MKKLQMLAVHCTYDRAQTFEHWPRRLFSWQHVEHTIDNPSFDHCWPLLPTFTDSDIFPVKILQDPFL